MKTDLHRISTTTLSAITAFAFIAGAICAGWAVGKFSTSGNAADWVAAASSAVAAFGAWAIGIGANNYAREAHLQRQTEQLQLRRDATEGRARRFNVMLIKVKRASKLRLVTKDALPPGVEGPLNLPSMLSTVEAVSRIIDTLKWSAEDAVLINLVSQQLLDALEGRILGVYSVSELIKRSIERSADNEPGAAEEELMRFRGQFHTLAIACTAAHQAAEALAPRLEARIEELNAEVLWILSELRKLNPDIKHG